METFNIFLIGAGTGTVFSVISMLLINANNAEQYPVGGFLPALWMVAELGVDSKIVGGRNSNDGWNDRLFPDPDNLEKTS